MVFVSPRQRAHTTFHLLFDHMGQNVPQHVTSELVREWDYGYVLALWVVLGRCKQGLASDYEGLKTSEIRKTRPGWDIFKDGWEIFNLFFVTRIEVTLVVAPEAKAWLI
jgi:broad specificity phosphatase PhoE